MIASRPRPTSPLITFVLGVVMLALGAAGGRHEVQIHLRGHRALARIASVTRTRSRHGSGSTTHLTFSTISGAASECNISGDLGEVGRPIWIRYLSSEPSRCSDDQLGRALGGSIMLVGVGALMVASAYVLHRRAQRDGDALTRRRAP